MKSKEYRMYNKSSKFNKEKIIEAAKEIFLDKGFKESTIALIAEKAGLGYGTVYSHFPSGKDEILLHMMEDVMEQFYQVASRDYSPNSKAEGYASTLKNTTDFLYLATAHKDFLIVIHEAIGMSPSVQKKWDDIVNKLIKRVANNILKVKEKGLLRNNDTDPTITAGSLIYPAEKFLWQISLNRMDKDHETIAKNIVDLYINGLFKE